MRNAIVTGKKIAVLAFFVLCPLRFSWAQLHPANAAGVTMGQLHYSVPDLEASRKFWIALGGAAGEKLDGMEVIKFPGVVILLSRGNPSAGTEGSVIDHVGFRVPSVPKTLEQMQAAGYKIDHGNGGPLGHAYTPDGDKIELIPSLSLNVKFDLDGGRRDFEVERNNRASTTAIEMHHVHYYVAETAVAAVKTWYVRTFGAVPGRRFHYESAGLPGVEIDIMGVATALPPTKGRTLDGIGFEVKNLEEFCKKLQANGVALTMPYSRRSSGVATAAFSDPWGVSVELTEGLDAR